MNNKSVTWWAGWIVLLPFRILFYISGFVIITVVPSHWERFIAAMKEED